jgi:hypothetical protein
MSVELVQFMSQLLNLMVIQIFTYIFLKVNAVDSKRMFIFFAEFRMDLPLIRLAFNDNDRSLTRISI